MGRLKENYIDRDYQLTTMYGIETTSNKNKMVLCKSQPMLSLPKTNLTLNTLKIFDIYLARINPHDPTITRVVFTKKELCKVLGVDRLNNKDLKESLRSLVNCVVTIETKGKDQSSTILTGLLSDADIHYSDDYYGDITTIELSCTEKAKKYIYNVDTVGYLKMNLAMVLSFEGRNAYALYQYLAQNLFRFQWSVKVKELKEYLGLDGKYDLFQNFERRVLIPAKKEIEEKTKLRFTYTKIKVGKSIQKIRFHIIKNQEPVEEPEPEDDDDLALPFAKSGERIDLGRYRFDDEYPFN